MKPTVVAMLKTVDLNRRSWALVAYSIVAFFVCFWRLGAGRIIQMEGMVSDGARSMLASGDWLVPRVYGEIYTFKPALAYWFAAIAHGITDPAFDFLRRRWIGMPAIATWLPDSRLCSSPSRSVSKFFSTSA